MEEKYENRQIAETQEADSQETIVSQQFYTCNDYSEIWGTLTYPDNNIFNLTARATYFGREEFRTLESDVKSYVFNVNNMKKNVYDRLSKTHFLIERDNGINSDSFEPAVITCKGRNGLMIGTTILKTNEKRILKDGDWILLPPNGNRIFRFSYTKSDENYIDRSCPIHKSFFIGSVIGRGACGEVRRVVKLSPVKKFNDTVEVFENYAIKCVLRPEDSLTCTKDEVFHALMNEVRIMKKVNHVHVLRLVDSYETIDHLILVFPFMGGGDLLSRIVRSPLKRLNEADAKYMFAQLVYGINYLHLKGITHRDIKPENILLNDRSDYAILAIADFGLSKMNDAMKTQCGTELYVAPEILKKKGNYTNAVDIWSSGIVLFAMLTGKMPFATNHKGTARDNILAGRYEFGPSQLWDRIPTAKNIINFMLQNNPRNRLTSTQLINHNWLKDRVLQSRLNQAYKQNDLKPMFFKGESNEASTEELEKTLVNVSINEQELENPPKRQKYS